MTNNPPNGVQLKGTVWIDQDLCTGDGLCEEIAPAVFHLLSDGLAYVVDPDGKVHSDPGGPADVVGVTEKDWDLVLEAEDECPGECIFVRNAEGQSVSDR